MIKGLKGRRGKKKADRFIREVVCSGESSNEPIDCHGCDLCKPPPKPPAEHTMTREQYLLTCLAEEAAEVAQRCSKAIRFGLQEIEPGQPDDNTRRLERELSDFLATAEALGLAFHQEDVAKKREKLKKYMDYSRSLGILEPHHD